VWSASKCIFNGSKRFLVVKLTGTKKKRPLSGQTDNLPTGWRSLWCPLYPPPGRGQISKYQPTGSEWFYRKSDNFFFSSV
jgi:hypothetical protein